MTWRLNRTATYWPPTPMAITAFLSRSPGLLNRGPGAQPLWDMFLIPASSLHLIWTSTAQSGVLRDPFAGCCFSLLHLIFSWLTSCLHPGYIIVLRSPSSCGRHKSHSIQPIQSQGYILISLDRMHLLFTLVHFLFWQLGRGHYVTIVHTWNSSPIRSSLLRLQCICCTLPTTSGTPHGSHLL